MGGDDNEETVLPTTFWKEEMTLVIPYKYGYGIHCRAPSHVKRCFHSFDSDPESLSGDSSA
jgi:hypothetical protein